MILQPQESSIVKLCLKDTRENISEIFFQPTISSHDIEIHPALHTVKNSCFPTVIRNLGNTAIHFNKGQVFGEATPSFLLKTNDKNICGSPNNNTPMCNLITPSEDILKKRKDELSETDFKLEHLNSDQKQLLLETLLDRSAAFSKSLKTIGCTDRVIPTFNFRSHNPIKTLPFEIPHAIQGTIKEELNELIEAGLIHRNISQWSSPMVLVKKKQNPTNPHKPASYRMAFYLRLLNTILENSTYPLPKIPTLINEISKYPFYTTIDFCKAYWQILLPEEMQDVLTFTTPFGTFASRRLVFGLKTAASKENTLADFFSRFPVNRTEISNTPQDEQELILPVVETHCNTINAISDTSLEISTSTWLKEQADDTQTNEIIQLLKNPSLKDSNNIRGFYIDPTTHILMFKSHRKSQAKLIVVPKSLQHKALDICHISHTGLDKTYQIVSNRYYWKGVYIDTKNFVLSCEQCIKNKSFTPKHAPPQSNRIPTGPGDYISVDIKGPLPNSGYVLTVLDHFSKHIVLYSLKNITAETVSKHILNYISIHGRPSQILSDRGLQFTSEVFSLINKTLGIKLSHTSPFHPQTNGQTERLNPAIESSILTLQERGVNLQNALLIHQNIYNGLIHPSTGYTPNLLHFGRNLPLIFDTFDNNS
ncbi:Uncharacterized protein K02A2.6 [Araneus ventricosus]|uniref:RNA-directed DNA polymerase n=1 Tax=Araneus ventricosus TaxID=182803 RepID=A0A4Y2K6W7_ARAVE|nr:Uncharacterized protein K02A2.6 [Araneus ventricosus]